MDRWIAAALDYVPRWIEHQMRITEQPGCVIAVAHKGQVLLSAPMAMPTRCAASSSHPAIATASPRIRRASPRPAS